MVDYETTTCIPSLRVKVAAILHSCTAVDIPKNLQKRAVDYWSCIKKKKKEEGTIPGRESK